MSSSLHAFLSFCGGFSHADLESILLENGIQTFLSYRCLETSVIPISQQTLEALEVSKFAVVMTSETKPYSAGFLEELIAILELQERGSLKVIPIFLTPFSFDLEEETCQEYPEKAPSWRAALTKLADIAADYPFSRILSGLSKSKRFNQIAHDIWLMFLSSTSNDSNALVAMDRHMKVVNDLLASQVNKDVPTIGIWGCVGVGKTTLARYIYAQISERFQTHVFLENVETIKDKILKSEGEEDPKVITSVDHDGHELIEARRKHRKVLLIADDVDTVEQGKWIIEYADWFSPGSTVILISQTKNLLVEAGLTNLYEVRSLRYDEALQLFSQFSFKQPYPPSDFEQLAVRAVHLAGFLPLALRLLGSFLSGRGQEEWVAALLKLKAKQGENIMEVWKLIEPLGERCQKEWEAAADLMKRKESSSQDTGTMEWKAAADIMKRIESSSQDTGTMEWKAAADIMKRTESSSQDTGTMEWEAAAAIMEGKEPSQDKGQEEWETSADIKKGSESSEDKT